MSVRIVTAKGDIAILDQGRWTSENAELAGILNENFTVDNIPGYEPSPYNYLAKKAVEEFGGEVTHHEPPEVFVPGRVY